MGAIKTLEYLRPFQLAKLRTNGISSYMENRVITKADYIMFAARIERIEDLLEILNPANSIEQDQIMLLKRELQRILIEIEAAGKPILKPRLRLLK